MQILHDVHIAAPGARVFEGVTTPGLLDEWWTRQCSGVPRLGARYDLGFTPEYAWQATVTRVEAGRAFELTMGRSDADWEGTRVGFAVEEDVSGTRLKFSHDGWREANEHFRVSSYCWAVYLRVLKRYLEAGIRVPYEERGRV